jgi:hypothetical protein
MPIDSLEPFRQSLQFARPDGLRKFKIIPLGTNLSDEKKEDHDTTIYLQEVTTGKYIPLYWNPGEGLYTNLLGVESKESTITLTENKKNFLDIASKCKITIDAYYWANPAENFLNNLEINVNGKDSIFSLIEGHSWFTDEPWDAIASENPSQKTSKIKFTGVDGAVFCFLIELLRIIHHVSVCVSDFETKFDVI